MKNLFALISLLALSSAAFGAALTRRHQPGTSTNPMYIIAWANNLSAADITSRSESLGSQVFGDSLSAENKPIDVAIGSFKATCAYLDSDTRAKLNADSSVLWIEEDTEMEFDQEVLPGDIFYNLDLLDGRKDSIFDSTMLGRAGEGVDIYVVGFRLHFLNPIVAVLSNKLSAG